MNKKLDLFICRFIVIAGLYLIADYFAVALVSSEFFFWNWTETARSLFFRTMTPIPIIASILSLLLLFYDLVRGGKQ